MSRRDFEALAAWMRAEECMYDSAKMHAGAAGRLADVCAATNPRFDRVRFLRACRPGWIVGSTREKWWDAEMTKGDQ